MKKAILNHSGGMDSSCLLISLLAGGYSVKTLSFFYGQKHSFELEKGKELVTFLAKLGHKVERTEIDLSSAFKGLYSSLLDGNAEVPEGHYSQGNMVETVVPNRNAIMSSISYAHALSLSHSISQDVSIFMGIHAGDHAIYPDCRPEFREKIEEAFKLGNWGSERVSFVAPFLKMDKTDILRGCLEDTKKMNLDFDQVMSMTSTSYNVNSKGEASGRTGSDIERIEAFLNIGRVDPISYVGGWDEASLYAKNTIKWYKENSKNIF